MWQVGRLFGGRCLGRFCRGSRRGGGFGLLRLEALGAFDNLGRFGFVDAEHTDKVVGLDSASHEILRTWNTVLHELGCSFLVEPELRLEGLGGAGDLAFERLLLRGIFLDVDFPAGQLGRETGVLALFADGDGQLVLVDGHLYGTGSNTLICLNIKTGEIAWQNRSAGKGSVAYADGHIYLYGEKNQVALVEANPDEYIEKGRFDVPKGEWPTWAHPIVANGRFYLRDMNNLTCYDVSSK